MFVKEITLFTKKGIAIKHTDKLQITIYNYQKDAQNTPRSETLEMQQLYQFHQTQISYGTPGLTIIVAADHFKLKFDGETQIAKTTDLTDKESMRLAHIWCDKIVLSET